VLERGRAAGVVDGAGARREARAVVVNADPWAIADGHFGASVRKAVDAADRRQRSLSAITWAVAGRAEAFPLLHHNVFFSSDYALEFEQLGAQGRVPSTPTVYLCAQHVGAGEERGVADRDGAYLVLVNAPPRGDEGVPTAEEQIRCRAATFALMQACGLTLTPTMPPVVATPRELAQMFPGTGGALYGPATHGWRTPFSRPGSRTRIAGLYLAGGGTHPGAGVPLVALSGRFAAQAVAEDLGSTRRSRPGATSGGTSTSSPRTGDTR
jgi:1-hydroxycarotenoid 3,4-desaturase